MRKFNKNKAIIKKLSIFLMILILLLETTVVSAGNKIQCDYGVTFEIASCWVKDTFNTNVELLDLKFINKNDDDILMVAVTDFYSMLDESDKQDLTRRECDNSIFDTETILHMLGDGYEINDVFLEKNGENEFFVIEASDGTRLVEFDFIFFNGYMVQFQWWGGGRAESHVDLSGVITSRASSIKQHRAMLASLDLSSIKQTEQLDGGQKMILSLVATIFLYLLVPIIIRFKHKKALEKKKATKIALINSIIVGLMCLIISAIQGNTWTPITATLYFFVNRYLLTVGNKYKAKIKEPRVEELARQKEQTNKKEVFGGTGIVSIGAKIAILREQRGLTQKQLAEHLRVTTGTIAEWESGEIDLTVENMVVIAEFFNVSLDYLVLNK